jgi:DNA-binding NarL/FixJ family response regulator
MIRVLIADDHPPIRAGIRDTIEDSGFTVCAEASNAADAVQAAVREHPDLCLIDVVMPGNGIDAARAITTQVPDTVVVMLTVSSDDDDLFAALRAGAVGYLLKDDHSERLPAALRGVLRGEAALPRDLVRRLIIEFQDRETKRMLFRRRRGRNLSDRESAVLELLREGLSTAEIAERLFISQATVRSHIATTLRKLHVPDRLSAVRLLEGNRRLSK